MAISKKIARDFHRRRLRKQLSAAAIADFYRMIWAVDAIQANRVESGARFIKFPREAATTDIKSNYLVYKWLLEDLCNEFLLASHKNQYTLERKLILDCSQFQTVALLVNNLKEVQEAESKNLLANVNVLDELPRIGHKQFEWQRGFWNLPDFYRAAFIFGGERARNQFRENNGLELTDFIKIGVGLCSIFQTNPHADRHQDGAAIGVTADDITQTLKLLARPFGELRKKAIALLAEYDSVSYRPSIFRQMPILYEHENSRQIYCPLPDLILWRITDGIYYDITADDGAVRGELGARFESYCRDCLEAWTGEFRIDPEYRYKIKGNTYDSPDFLLSLGDVDQLIVECKYKKMPFGAKFSVRPRDALPEGIHELVKGVFQVWRYFSHVRRGLAPRANITKDAMGLVVTMDPWLTMTVDMYQRLLADAEKLAAEKDKEIIEEDRRPIAFSEIRDLETLMRISNDESFIETIRLAASQKYSGWLLSSIHRLILKKNMKEKDFPFRDRLGDLLPWWGEVEL